MNKDDLYIKQIMVGPMMNYAYLVGDRATKSLAIIDPGFEGARLVDEACSEGFDPTHILVTHAHFDHVNDVAGLADKFGLKVVVHKDEAGAFGGISNVIEVADGDSVEVGGLRFDVVHTPGHSPGSVCFKTGGALFTGDTLFVDGIGRIDLEGGDAEEMYNSMQKIKKLPDGVVIFPGHNYGPAPTSTVGEQKKTNPYLQERPLSDFLRIA